MSKRLLITSTDLMMIQFLVPHVIHLSENGYEVEIACSVVGGRMDEIREKLKEHVKEIHQVRLVRSPASPKNFLGYRDMKKVIDGGNYDIIWTNEPVMGVVTRLAAKKARKRGTKVVYMVHGFHFYKGAPKKYWLIFYPIEKLMSKYADIIVTINKEDYHYAKGMYSKEVKYIHGIGVNTERLQKSEEQCDIRQQLNISKEDFVIISAGELNENKNHRVIIRAVAELNNPEIHYIVCGKGELLEELQILCQELNVEENVHFLGYRTDVVDLCAQSDIFAFPSHREGLGLAALEAMYCGLPLVTSNIRGLVDVMRNGETGYLCKPDNATRFAKAIRKLKNSPELCKKMGELNRNVVKPYCIENTLQEVNDILNTI